MRKLFIVVLLTFILPIIILTIPTSVKAPSFSNEFLNQRFGNYFHNIVIPERNKLILDSIIVYKNGEFNKFIQYLGHEESRNDWKIINRLGYLGEWQFGTAARKQVGFGHITRAKFKKNPWIFPKAHQEIALKRLLNVNQKTLINHKVYYEYLHSTIKGIYITKSGLLAASHLGGAGNVIKFLRTKGKYDFADANGTKVSEYMKKFSNYKF